MSLEALEVSSEERQEYYTKCLCNLNREPEGWHSERQGRRLKIGSS